MASPAVTRGYSQLPAAGKRVCRDRTPCRGWLSRTTPGSNQPSCRRWRKASRDHHFRGYGRTREPRPAHAERDGCAPLDRARKCGSGTRKPRLMSTLSASAMPLDVLAIAAHRDDVEQTCGGTLLRMAQRGRRTGILDLTQGEMGTRGTAEDRAQEAADAARILRVSWRQALDIADGRVENSFENRLKVARVIREQRPRVVILPYWEGRHPDHYTASTLGYEACFLAGLAKLDVSVARAP